MLALIDMGCPLITAVNRAPHQLKEYMLEPAYEKNFGGLDPAVNRHEHRLVDDSKPSIAQ